MTKETKSPLPDEVEKALARAARNLGWLEALPPYGDKDTRKAAADDMCRALAELRAHIAALEKNAKSDLEIICNAISSNGWATGHADTISDIAREIDLQIKQSKSQFSALTAELETYRRNDAGGCYSNRKDRETY